MSSPSAPPSEQGIPGGHKHFQHEADEKFLALIEEQRENINGLVGGNFKLKKIVHVTKQVVSGILYHITAEFEGENQPAEFTFKLIDKPWDQPQERVFEHQRVE
uniref:Cystatin domain-containing protein n=1 Tax=Nyssomyia neivai TaxID=330878 RepID=A0A1L8D879_9DIPT